MTHPKVTELTLKQAFNEDDEVGNAACIQVDCSELRKLRVEQVQDEVEEISIESGDKLQYCKFREVVRGIKRVRFGEGVVGIRKIEIQKCGVKSGETEFEFA